MVRGTFPSPRGPFDLYNFVSDADRKLLVDRGVLPWWTHPHLTIRFFRPLSSLIRWTELRLGHHPLLEHVHSLAWWIAAVLAARALYRRWLSPRATILATAIFALAPCHATPVAWIANREVLIAVVFGTLGLVASARARSEGGARPLLLAFLFFTLAMLSGEYALAFGGYALASLVLERTPFERRVFAFGAFAVPAVVTLAVRHALGYGNAGSSFYRDPFTQTADFFSGAPRRIAELAFDGWLSLDADWVKDAEPWLLGIALVLLVVLMRVAVRPGIDALSSDARRATRALAWGSVLALAPLVGVAPKPRLLGVVMLGIAPVVAVALDRAWFPSAEGAAPRGGILALALAFFQLVHAPVMTLFGGRDFREVAVSFTSHAREIVERTSGDPLHAKVVLARTGWQNVIFLPFALRADGKLPERWWVLSLTPHALLVRTGPRSVEIVVPKGRSYFPTGPTDLFRSIDDPLGAGDVVRVPGMTATVVQTGEHHAARLRFDFDDSLDSMLWVADGRNGWRDATPPMKGFGMPLDP